MERAAGGSGPGGAESEAAGLRSRWSGLRQAAAVPEADLRPLLDAALAELEGAVDALSASTTGDGPGHGPSGAVHAERRLLHTVFQQAPVPLFVVGKDGAIRRVNAAAGELLGSGPGYATGKLFTAFIDPPSRAAVQTLLAAAARTGEPRQLRCAVLTGEGAADQELAVQPVTVSGDLEQLVVAVTAAGTGPAEPPGPTGSARPAASARRAQEPGEPGEGIVEAMTRRLDLVTAATRILLENVTYSEPLALQQCARLLARELAAWVIVDAERDGSLARQVVAGPEDQQSQELAQAVAAMDPQPASAPGQVYESGSSLLLPHAEDLGALGDGPAGLPLLMALGASSVLCVPLSDGERTYGVLTMAGRAGQGHFGMADVGLVEELGEQLALAIRADRLFRRRSEIADALQASLLPRQLRQIPGTEIAALHVAATNYREVGGDFYDVYPAEDGWATAIGDVCGKGEDAAAVIAAARHAIRAFAHTNPDPAAVLASANGVMLTEEFGGRFVTAAVGHVRWRRRRLHVVLGSAGHPAPVLIRPDGRTRALRGGGQPLGIFPDASPAIQELNLEPGDVLFFYTDGLTTACAPDMIYFEDRLTDELAVLAGKPPAVLVSQVRDLVLEFCQGELRDDITMLALRVGEPPPAPRTAATRRAAATPR
jgi:serine phosphatase RsbU (regulator of sigma subunit)/PAS domain-containing protein